MCRIIPIAILACFATPVFAAPANSAAPLDKLFADLAKTTSSDQAKPIEDRIVALFEQSNSPTVDLLMQRSTVTLKIGDKETTAKLIQAITVIAPTYPEGWRRLAMLDAAANDDADAIAALQKTVTLNPREFEAQASLGHLLEAYGDKKAALAAYRKALAVDPHMAGVEQHTQELTRQVEGEKI